MVTMMTMLLILCVIATSRASVPTRGNSTWPSTKEKVLEEDDQLGYKVFVPGAFFNIREVEGMLPILEQLTLYGSSVKGQSSLFQSAGIYFQMNADAPFSTGYGNWCRAKDNQLVSSTLHVQFERNNVTGLVEPDHNFRVDMRIEIIDEDTLVVWERLYVLYEPLQDPNEEGQVEVLPGNLTFTRLAVKEGMPASRGATQGESSKYLM